MGRRPTFSHITSHFTRFSLRLQRPLTSRRRGGYNGGEVSAVSKCESCMFYDFDEEYDDYVCTADLDEDDVVRLMEGRSAECPFWRPGDDYRTARRQ